METKSIEERIIKALARNRRTGMTAYELSRILNIPKRSINRILSAGLPERKFSWNGTVWFYTGSNESAARIRDSHADDEGLDELSFNNRVSKSDVEKHPSIYTLYPFDETDGQALQDFLERMDASKYHKTLSSFHPGKIESYFLFLRNKAGYMRNPHFTDAASLLVSFILWSEQSVEYDLSHLYDDSIRHLNERRPAEVSAEYIEMIVTSIIRKVNKRGQVQSLPLVPLPLPSPPFAYDGETAVAWKYVRFQRGKVIIDVPPIGGKARQPYVMRARGADESWNLLKRFFDRIPMYRVRMKRGRVAEVLRKAPFDEYIDNIRLRSSWRKKETDQIMIFGIPMTPGMPVTKDYFTSRTAKKSRGIYIDILCEAQLDGYKIYPFRERVTHHDSETPETGCAFVIHEDDSCNLEVAFENTTDESRATLVFTIPKAHLNAVVSEIIAYLDSDAVNKRQSLQYGRYLKRGNGQVIPYRRIMHSSIFEWKRSVYPYWPLPKGLRESSLQE